MTRSDVNINDPLVRAAADAIAKVWSDQGKLIEGGWAAWVHLYGKHLSTEELEHRRNIFFLGAQHLWASMMGVLDPGNEPTDQDMNRMDKIMNELETFRRGKLG